MSEIDTVPRGPSSSEGPRGRGVLLVVLVLVNSAAIWGQTEWFRSNAIDPGWDWRVALVVSLLLAASLELVGVFLAQMADRSDDRGQPSGGPRLGSYAAGVASGALNLSHWLHVGTAAGITFALLSASSPFLWGVWARVRRGRSVAPSRRFWHPIRSVKLIRHMAWEGIVDETEGIRDLEFRTDPEVVPVSPAPAAMTKEDWAREAFRIREQTGLSWEKIAAELGISPSYLYHCRKSVGK